MESYEPYNLRYFTQAVWFSGIVNQQVTTIIAMSNRESTNLQSINEEQIRDGRQTPLCYWALFDVWVFDGLMLGNIAGITETKHNGTLAAYNLGEFIEQTAATWGNYN